MAGQPRTDAVFEIAAHITHETKLEIVGQQRLMRFVSKCLTVLLAEGLSNTCYQILEDVMVADGQLDTVQALLARSIYAVLITLYATVMSWVSSKSARAKKTDFLGLCLQLHATVCPVLLAWGWKDWAAALDKWSGPELWDEVVVAISLTLVVAVAQAFPCFRRFKAAVAEGGESDTLLARIVILPSNLGLTLGYVWNMVATYFVQKVQSLNGLHHYVFAIQAAYTLIVGVSVTFTLLAIAQRAEKQKSDSSDPGKPDKMYEWGGAVQKTWTDLLCSVLAFVYAWALLDSCDDWAFGVMFGCSGPTACSYQSNFVYAMTITVVFSYFSSVLCTWQQLESENTSLGKAISLQINAMVLTVGWAWMNFYSAWTSHATKGASVLHTMIVYVIVLIFIVVFVALFNFVFQKVSIVTGARRKQILDRLRDVQSTWVCPTGP
eukprot:TRINITY_DN29906_c0_g1_i1.p1 TRINITY_DN29906_c0_g1~~TRINITY_DN29906_c0_g1_i1.p1  ORF type:complete len:452 (-),score=35.33 TRINITY_DN29906_c0_g1_i1:447-1754(-)